MHDSVMNFVRRVVPALELEERSRVLEVGALDVNGSVRPLFNVAGVYIGLDQREGKGVDVVGLARALPFDDGWFDVVVCTEMLEHDPTFWLSIAEMGRVLRDRGSLIVTTRGIAFPRHDEPIDCYRFTNVGLAELFKSADCDRELVVEEDPQASGVFAVGRRRVRSSVAREMRRVHVRKLVKAACDSTRCHGMPKEDELDVVVDEIIASVR